MSNIYLAADFSRQEEMGRYRDILEGLGHTITSSWLDNLDKTEGVGINGIPITNENLACLANYANIDISDIRNSDIVILFTTGKLTRGGRQTEFGIARAWQKQLVIVGPREHVFHCLPEIQQYPTWHSFVIEFSRGAFTVIGNLMI